MNQDKPKKVKDCQFISLYDMSILKDVRLPPNPNNILLWYKKDNHDQWGLTVKSFEEGQDLFTKQYTWKVTWVNNTETLKLTPTKSSETFCDAIAGDLYASLQKVIDASKNKLLKKK
jgi:hypothetical protein